MTDKPKVVGLADRKSGEPLFLVKTRMGQFVGKEILDSNGDVAGFKDCYEMLHVQTQQGPAILGMKLGEMIEAPEEALIFELDFKSPYYQRYKEDATGLQLDVQAPRQ